MTHALKTTAEELAQILAGNKTFEIRRKDRTFKVGDKLLLQVFDEKEKQFTGDEATLFINQVVNKQPGISRHLCIIGFSTTHPVLNTAIHNAGAINMCADDAGKEPSAACGLAPTPNSTDKPFIEPQGNLQQSEAPFPDVLDTINTNPVGAAITEVVEKAVAAAKPKAKAEPKAKAVPGKKLSVAEKAAIADPGSVVVAGSGNDDDAF